MFARKLEELRSHCSNVDQELLASLNRVSINIDFLREIVENSEKRRETTETDDDKIYITPFEIQHLEKVYRCRKCSTLFQTNTQAAVDHIVDNFPEYKCQQQQSQQNQQQQPKQKLQSEQQRRSSKKLNGITPSSTTPSSSSTPINDNGNAESAVEANSTKAKSSKKQRGREQRPLTMNRGESSKVYLFIYFLLPN